MKNNLENGLWGMFWMGGMTVANFLIQLVITSFLARLLSPSDYGEVAALTVLIGLADIFWMMGVGPGIVQKNEITDEDISTGQNLNILFGIIVFAIINIFADGFARLFSIYNISMLRIFSLIFIINSMYSVPQSLLQRACNFKMLAITKTLSIVVYGIVAIFLGFRGCGPWALMMGTMAQNLICMIIFLITAHIKFSIGINKKSAKELLFFGSGYTIAKLFSYIANNGDNFVINKTLGKSLLGNYTKAYQLLMYPVTLLGDTLDQVLFPILSREQSNNFQLKRAFLYGTNMIALLSAPICIVAYWAAEDLVLFFLGSQWNNVILPFRIMIIGLFFRIGYKLSDSLVIAIGKVYKRAYRQIIYAILVVVGAYIGHYKGLPGVALGVTIAFTINYFTMTSLSMRSINVSIIELARNLSPVIMNGVMCFYIVHWIIDFLGKTQNYFLNCVIITLITFILYFSSYVVIIRRLMEIEFNEFMKEIFQMIKRKFIH